MLKRHWMAKKHGALVAVALLALATAACSSKSNSSGGTATKHWKVTLIAGTTADNLGAISAAVIGGTSLFGGRGTVAGTVIGVLIPATLASGFVTIGVNPYWQYVAVGVVLIGAVYLDQIRRRTREHS